MRLWTLNTTLRSAGAWVALKVRRFSLRCRSSFEKTGQLRDCSRMAAIEQPFPIEAARNSSDNKSTLEPTQQLLWLVHRVKSPMAGRIRCRGGVCRPCRSSKERGS
jgi:hypothetical protein